LKLSITNEQKMAMACCFARAVELIFEGHARADVPLLPQHIHHLPPPAHLRVQAFSPRLGDDLGGKTEEHRRVRHRIVHEPREELVGVDDGERPRSCAACTSTPSALEAGRNAAQCAAVGTRMMPSPLAMAPAAKRQTARLRNC
jgi:hypothetical protein